MPTTATIATSDFMALFLCAAMSRFGTGRRIVEAIACKTAFDQVQRVLEIVILIGIGLHDVRRSGVEQFVLLMASGEFGSHHLPGELEQFDPFVGGNAR